MSQSDKKVRKIKGITIVIIVIKECPEFLESVKTIIPIVLQFIAFHSSSKYEHVIRDEIGHLDGAKKIIKYDMGLVKFDEEASIRSSDENPTFKSIWFLNKKIS